MAVAFAVLDLTGSATDLGLVLAATYLPMAAFLLVGVVAMCSLREIRTLERVPVLTAADAAD